MSKKIVVKADLVGRACMSDILSVVATLQGIKSMDIDADKCTLTVVGTVDPVCIAHRLKKKCFAVSIVSVEDDKPKPPEKKDPCKEACEKLVREVVQGEVREALQGVARERLLLQAQPGLPLHALRRCGRAQLRLPLLLLLLPLQRVRRRQRQLALALRLLGVGGKLVTHQDWRSENAAVCALSIISE
uniref:HMA domain-containing protein n=1 Tax=Zea mays TaxID=4577 RepID=G2XK60_MAIZE|nr:hypothetical protein rf1-C1-g1 [Zea mays]